MYVCIFTTRFRRFNYTVGLPQLCMLENFLKHIYIYIHETLRLITFADAYLNMSDQTLISDEANTKQNYIWRNILFIQKGTERYTELMCVITCTSTVGKWRQITKRQKADWFMSTQETNCAGRLIYIPPFRKIMIRFSSDTWNFSSKHPSTRFFWTHSTSCSKENKVTFSGGLIGQGVKLNLNKFNILSTAMQLGVMIK